MSTISLKTACKAATPRLVIEALAGGSHPMEFDTDGSQAFHWLATSGGASPERYKEVFDILLGAGCSLIAQDNIGRTPLYLAVLNSKLEVRDFLINAMLERGLTHAFELRTNQGRTVLQMACDSTNGNAQSAMKLAMAGVDLMPHLNPGADPQSPMLLAKERGAIALCRLMYAMGADPSDAPPNFKGMTRIEAALGFPNVMATLLDQKLDPFQPDEFERLCLKCGTFRSNELALLQAHQAKRTIEAIRSAAPQMKG